MRNKLWFLTSYSLNKKVKNKWFVIANLFLAVLLIGIINIDSIISFFGGSFNDTQEILVLDETNETYDLLVKSLENAESLLGNEQNRTFKKVTGQLEKLEEDLKDTNQILVVLEENENAELEAKVITEEYIDTLDYQLLVQALSEVKQIVALQNSSIDPIELAKVTSPINIERILLDENKNTQEENMEMVMGTVFPTVILPFFILVIFLIQMIGAEINEEKSSRSMEIIISNVSPKTHFFSKILASNLFVIIQGALLLLYGGIGLLLHGVFGRGSFTVVSDVVSEIWNGVVQTGFADKLIYVIPLTLVLMILSFLAYSLIAGILASLTVNLEDYQQIQTPIMLVCLVGYYLAIMAGMFEGSILIKVLSFVPFISCLLAPALLMIGQMSIIEVVIAILILGIFDYVVMKHGLKIYKAGILNYSTDKIWSKLWKVARTKE